MKSILALTLLLFTTHAAYADFYAQGFSCDNDVTVTIRHKASWQRDSVPQGELPETLFAEPLYFTAEGLEKEETVTYLLEVSSFDVDSPNQKQIVIGQSGRLSEKVPGSYSLSPTTPSASQFNFFPIRSTNNWGNTGYEYRLILFQGFHPPTPIMCNKADSEGWLVFDLWSKEVSADFKNDF
jgi:hypothetical protein